MPLRLDHLIIWDFWLAPRLTQGDPFHIFFLQAPRSIPDPGHRHNLATVGHAISHDLSNWSYVGTALGPAPPGSWDDFTIWTGCVVHHDHRWYMFYTGRSRAENGQVQRIGIAMSDDLSTWSRVGEGAVLEADPRWYQRRNDNLGLRQDCRDPWVLRRDNEWLMYFTSTHALAKPDGRGVIGLATSEDLMTWEHQGPITRPGQFSEIEVPQVVQLGGQWLMLFCTAQHSLERQRKGLKWNGSHYFTSDSPYGSFSLAPGEPLLAGEHGTLYAARIVDDPWIEPCLLAWRRWNESGNFAGDITDPIPLTISPNGRLAVVS